ncbi:DUF805 domain-containing protein [Rhodobacter lacus]|uniref:DUF805 domain-containing protein n=1 Tax=Rhodobacter lacus TaxID=1641972 RepID=A0ABW5A886_9RHOB
MAKAWHYAWQGKSEGPVDAPMMGDLIRAGRVRAETLVWSEGMGEWERADQHFPFAKPLSPEPLAGPPPLGNAAPPLHGAPPHHSAPARSFLEAVQVCFQKYATFRGRASRSEYWFFQLFILLGTLLTSLLEGGMGRDGQVISGLFSLATFLPSLSAAVRRLHDTNHSGWWIGAFYLSLIPVSLVVGFIAASLTPHGSESAILGVVTVALAVLALAYTILILVFLVSRGTPGPNRFDQAASKRIG